MAKVKVLYLCPVGYIGGAERFILNLLQVEQNSQTLNSQVLLLNPGVMVQELEALKISCHTLPFRIRFRNFWQLARAIFFLKNYLKLHQIDIVHSTMPYAHLLVSLATLGNSKIKKIWFQHGPVGGLLDRLASFFTVDRILFNSQYLKEEHNRTSWQRSHIQKQFVFPLAVAPKFFLEENEREVSSIFQILALGRIYSWKGYDIIIRALSLLQKELLADHQVRLIIQGSPQGEEGEKYLGELKHLALELDLANVIEFKAFDLRVEELLKRTQLFIHAPRGAEPFGYVVAEAMAARCMVIGVSKGGVAELLAEGRGVMFDSTSEDAPKVLAKEIINILNGKKNKITFQTMLDKAQKYVREKHHSKKVAEELEALYHSLMRPGPTK